MTQVKRTLARVIRQDGFQVAIEIWQILDVDLFEIEQLQRLGKDAFHVNFERVVTGTRVDVGTVQQFGTTGKDGVIGTGGKAWLEGATVVLGGGQDDACRLLGGGGRFDQARVAIRIENQVMEEVKIGG